MDLTIGKEGSQQVSVAHYTDDGTEDSLVMLEYPSFEPMYMRGKLTNTKMKKRLISFFQNGNLT